MHQARLLLVLVSSVLAAAPWPAQATPPPPPPPCVPAGPGVTNDALGRIIAGKSTPRESECAAKDLAARGAAAIPVALRLLRHHDEFVGMAALMVLADMGPQAQAALPALMERLRRPRAFGDKYLYDAVAALGPAARPAIPLLISRARAPADPYFPAHTLGPLQTLGRLGKHDPGRVVPHLLSMLQDREKDQMVLGALADIGKDARAALPAILVSLERAKIAGDSRDGGAAVYALVAIGEPDEIVPVLTGLLHHPVMAHGAVLGLLTLGPAAASAVPALIGRLGSNRHDQIFSGNIASALATIAPGSPAVQRQLLAEATQYQNEMAALALAGISPLPPDFAPALSAALVRKPDDYFLSKALDNTR